MKKVFTLLAVFAFAITLFSQVPKKMSYQAVVRNAGSELVKNTTVGMQVSILQGSETGTVVYVETHSKTTNENGLVTLEIGDGTIVSGTFGGIDWSKGLYFLKTEIDPSGGTNYSISGTNQLLSVPYALFAKSSSKDSANKAYVDNLEQQLQDLQNIVYNQLPLPTNGLIAYYPFNGNANDGSGNGYNGTVNGATLTYDRFVKSNSAYHVVVTDGITTTFGGVLGNADRSVSFWVKINIEENGGGICSYGGGIGGAFNPAIYTYSNQAVIDISNATTGDKISKVNDNIWHHYVYIFSTQYGTYLNGVRIFQDGVLLTDRDIANSYNYTTTVNTSSAQPFIIGGNTWDQTSFSIDDIRFYNRVITDAEILQLYHEGGYLGVGEVSDIDGNSYNTVKIGTQIWMAENLKTTQLNDGTGISNITINTDWANLTSAGYCWNNNDKTSYKNPYGALYNWYAVNTSKLCPLGWHMPTDAEWTALETYLGGSSIAGGKLKETGTIHWASNNTGATNESGFTAVGGGYRFGNGSFYNPPLYVGDPCNMWSATESTSTIANARYISAGGAIFYTNSYDKKYGFSVRCLKD